MEDYGTAIATIGTAEKGYFDVRIEVESPGGHSSVPPKHTVRYLVIVISEYIIQVSFARLSVFSPLYSCTWRRILLSLT